MTYALDSNIVSYFLKNDSEVKRHFQNALENNSPYVIPPLVYYEVKRWLRVRSATNQLQRFTDLYNDSVKSDMTADIWEKATELYTRLRLSGKIIDDADIFIASYCILNSYTLVTNNIKHFDLIPELNIVNWKT
jgi:tRNA(fMet)-specific endonuclease VapC